MNITITFSSEDSEIKDALVNELYNLVDSYYYQVVAFPLHNEDSYQLYATGTRRFYKLQQAAREEEHAKNEKPLVRRTRFTKKD